MSKAPPDSAPEEPGIVISVDNGKYTFIQRPEGGCVALRYGEDWLSSVNMTGTGMLLAFAHELQAARARVKALEDEIAARGDGRIRIRV